MRQEGAIRHPAVENQKIPVRAKRKGERGSAVGGLSGYEGRKEKVEELGREPAQEGGEQADPVSDGIGGFASTEKEAVSRVLPRKVH